jgi:hypothetical protein
MLIARIRLRQLVFGSLLNFHGFHFLIQKSLPSGTGNKSVCRAEDELVNIIKEGMLRKNVAIMNISIYQDGTISPQTFELLKELNKTIHK